MSALAATDPGFAIRFFEAANQLTGIRALKPLMLEQLGLRRGHHVLEVGCGTGDDARAIARRVGPDGHVIGIDASSAIVAEAARRSAGRSASVEFRVGDALGLELPDASVDRCRMERVLMHVAGEPARAIAELARVLRPGGRAVVFDFDWDALVVDGAAAELTRRIVHSYSDGVAHGRIGRTLPRLLYEAGLVEVSVIPYAVEVPYDFFGWLVSGHLDAALAAGRFMPKELIGWWDELDAGHEHGRFFAAILGFVAVGTKPLGAE